MISRRPVNWATRPGGIIRDHSAQRCARTGRDIRAKTKFVRPEKVVELIQHDPGFDAHALFFEIQISDLTVVARKFDDQSFPDRVSNQAGPRTSRSDRNACFSRCANDRARFPRATRERRADRLDLVNRSIGRVELPRQIIEAGVATSLLDFPLLGGSHRIS